MNKFSSKTEPFVLSKFNKSILLALLLSTALLGCASGSSNEYSSSDEYSLDYEDPCAADPCAAEETYVEDPCAADPCAAEEFAYAPGELAFTPEEIELLYALSQLTREERAQIIPPEMEQLLAQQFIEFRQPSGQQHQSQPSQSLSDYGVSSSRYSNFEIESNLSDMRANIENELREGSQRQADSVSDGASF
ncbi:MAG: hypothetical protein WA949_20415 [Phormidesmis sp.]